MAWDILQPTDCSNCLARKSIVKTQSLEKDIFFELIFVLELYDTLDILLIIREFCFLNTYSICGNGWKLAIILVTLFNYEK